MPATTAAPTIQDLVRQERAALFDGAHENIEPMGLNRNSELVLDVAEIEMVSSEDLNDLIKLHTQLRHQSTCLVLKNVSSQIGQIFRLTRLDRLFIIRE